jgi:hypothetical protein
MLHAIISESFFNIRPLDDRDLNYIQMVERDGKRYLKRLADLDVEHWNALGVGLAVPPVQRVLRAIADWLVGRAGRRPSSGSSDGKLNRRSSVHD